MITTRAATREERRLYCAQVTDDLIVAVEDNQVIGYCEYKDCTIYLIESFRRGAGRALVDALPNITRAYHVCAGSEAFWSAMGFISQTSSRHWHRYE